MPRAAGSYMPVAAPAIARRTTSAANVGKRSGSRLTTAKMSRPVTICGLRRWRSAHQPKMGSETSFANAHAATTKPRCAASMPYSCAKSGSTGKDITITATDTLETLAAKVNSSSSGVSATIVNDASGSRLVFTSSTTGTDNAFRITAVDADSANTDASGLSALAFDPAGGTSATTITQPAANAAATINGLPVSSATNSLVNVFSGLTITLSKVTSAPVQLSVAQDTTAIKKSVQTFVDAYNALSSLLSTDLKYDSSSQTAGPLQGDSAASSLQRQLRGLVGEASSASSVFSTLSQVGLEFQTDGTLKINDSKLTSAMANPVELKKLFTNVDATTPDNNGFATKLRTLSNAVLGGDGLLTARLSGLSTKLTRNQKDQDTLNDRLEATRARLQAQYTALDAKMLCYCTTLTFGKLQAACATDA